MESYLGPKLDITEVFTQSREREETVTSVAPDTYLIGYDEATIGKNGKDKNKAFRDERRKDPTTKKPKGRPASREASSELWSKRTYISRLLVLVISGKRPTLSGLSQPLERSKQRAQS